MCSVLRTQGIKAHQSFILKHFHIAQTDWKMHPKIVVPERQVKFATT